MTSAEYSCSTCNARNDVSSLVQGPGPIPDRGIRVNIAVAHGQHRGRRPIHTGHKAPARRLAALRSDPGSLVADLKAGQQRPAGRLRGARHVGHSRNLHSLLLPTLTPPLTTASMARAKNMAYLTMRILAVGSSARCSSREKARHTWKKRKVVDVRSPSPLPPLSYQRQPEQSRQATERRHLAGAGKANEQQAF